MRHIESFEIDGRDFSTLEESSTVISRMLIPEVEWGHNLDALNDILRGGFGTSKHGFVRAATYRWARTANIYSYAAIILAAAVYTAIQSRNGS